MKDLKEKLDVIKNQYFDSTDMKRAFFLLKPFVLSHKRSYLILIFLLCIDIFLTIAFARFFGLITDAAISSNLIRLKWLIPVGSLLLLSSITWNFADIYFETKTLQGVKLDLKNHFFKHILRLPASVASQQHSGELISHFTTDIHSIDGLIGSGMLNLVRLPLIYITVFLYLIHINWQLSLISVLIAPIALISGGIFGILLRKNGHQIFSLNGRINTLLNETFHGFLVVRSFTLEKLFFKNYQKKNQELYDLELQNAKLQGWFYSGGEFVSSLAYIVSLCLGAYFVSIGNMTVGALMTFINLVNHLVYPLTGMAGQWAGFQRAVSALDRVLKVLDEPVASGELPSFTKMDLQAEPITFKNMTFSYDGVKNVFEHFHLNVPSGKVVALVGPSGAGKSTLFNLLQGFYQPQRGGIFIGDKQLHDFTISELRSSIATVPQETFLFAGTIRENLLMARLDITETDMVEAAKHANIHDFIMELPAGYDTEIGERGVRLSGGQKQRVAIARAILKDAPILLLDEATSALDSGTEHIVKEALEHLMRGRTTLVIAHRLSTIQTADLIVVIDHGQIVQMGQHDDLIQQEGLYQQLSGSLPINKEAKRLAIVSGD